METERRLLAYVKPHRRILILGLLCAAMTASITAVILYFIKNAFDFMVGGKPGRLAALCASVVLVFLLKGIFAFGQNYLLSMVANRVATALRDEMFAHLHSLSLSFFNRRRTGALMSTLTNDVNVVQSGATSLRDMVTAPITVVVCLVSIFVLNWRLSLVSLVFIPFMATVISRIGKRIRAISGLVQAKLADVTTIMEETVAGVRIIKSFAAEGHEMERFSRENHKTLHTVMKAVKRSAQLRPIIEFIGAFGIALVLFLAGKSIAHTNLVQQQLAESWLRLHPRWFRAPSDFPVPGGMTQGSLISFLYGLDALSRAVGEIGNLATVRAQVLAAAKRIFGEVLDVKSDVRESPHAVELGQISGHVRFDNVTFRYSSDGTDVLKDISFEVHPGEVIAIVGRSGAGKSTLVDLIPRFYDPTEGRIFVDGHDLRDVSLHSLRRQIGIVPQETWLFAGPLRDNIAYGNREAADEDIANAAASANASFIGGMPDGLDTVVGERGIRLSGGERQRIAIARAILMNPRLLILDEATSSLDASSESLVQEALDKLMRNRTTIIIAHRLSTIINADRILAMHDGNIVEMGSHRELISAGGYYAQLYETQLRGFE